MDDGRAVNNGVYCQKGDYIRCQQEGVKGGGREGESRRTGPKEKVRAQLVLLAGTKRTNTTSSKSVEYLLGHSRVVCLLQQPNGTKTSPI